MGSAKAVGGGGVMKTARVISFVVAVLLLTSSTFAQVRTTRLTSSSDYRWIYLYAHPDYGTTFDITLTWDSSTTMFWDIWYLHPRGGVEGNSRKLVKCPHP